MDSSAARGQPARPSRAALGPFVGDGVDGEARLFGVLRDQDAETGGVLESTAHDQWIVDADSVVGEHPDLPGAGGHHAHLGELGACQPHRDRADGMHVDEADLLAAVPDVVGDDRAVGDRIGVGHREHGGVSAQSRCCRTGFDILGIFPAGLAQMGVQIDEAGQQDLAGGVDDIGIVGYRQPGADVRDLAVGHQHVDLVALAVSPHPSDQYGVIAAPRVRSHALIASPPQRWAPSLGGYPLPSAHQQVEQHRHPDMHAVGNLLQHRRL